MAFDEELQTVATWAKISQIEDAVGAWWAVLAAGKSPQRKVVRTLLLEAKAEGTGDGK